jgi:membrane-bound lytic murein transglycosylase D
MKTLIQKAQIFTLISTLIFKQGFASVSWPKRIPDSFAPQQFNVISQARVMDKEKILSDYKNKIAEDFKIKESFKPRVSFWFDIYTKYSAQEEVVHHAEYPWIVFRVIDLRPILNAEGNRWTNYHKSRKFSQQQIKEIKDVLKSLSEKTNYSRLKGLEKEIFDKLSDIPGKRKKVIKEALANLRVQVGQKDYIETGLATSSLYTEKLEEIFAANNLPLELTRLPFVESSFNTAAVSKVGASGVWQIMPFMGKKLLIMNPHIDERNSPIKSAKVAAYILKENRMILKNWPLALTAYNHGAGSIQRAIKKTGTRDLETIIKKYHDPSFGFASQNFYASFLAILHAEKYRSETFRYIEPSMPIEFTEIKLTQKIKVKKFLEVSGLTQEDFQKLNLDVKNTAFKKNVFLPKGYVVHVPKQVADTLTAKSSRIALLVDSKSNMKIKL